MILYNLIIYLLKITCLKNNQVSVVIFLFFGIKFYFDFSIAEIFYIKLFRFNETLLLKFQNYGTFPVNCICGSLKVKDPSDLLLI